MHVRIYNTHTHTHKVVRDCTFCCTELLRKLNFLHVCIHDWFSHIAAWHNNDNILWNTRMCGIMHGVHVHIQYNTRGNCRVLLWYLTVFLISSWFQKKLKQKHCWPKKDNDYKMCMFTRGSAQTAPIKLNVLTGCGLTSGHSIFVSLNIGDVPGKPHTVWNLNRSWTQSHKRNAAKSNVLLLHLY